jgi:hypothetical protein
MLRTYSKSIICLTVSLHHLPVVPMFDYLFMMVIFSLILMPTEVWLELSIISHSQGQISPLLCIKFVSICLLQLLHTLLQPNEYFDTLKAHSTMVLNSLLVPFIYQLTQMLIGQVTQMIVDPLLGSLSTWAIMQSPGLQRNNLLYLAPLLNQSIEPWLSPLPRFAGFGLFPKILAFISLILLSSGAIMSLP